MSTKKFVIHKIKKFYPSNKIRKIIKDGIVLNFSKTNDLIQKCEDNSKQIKRINYTKYITGGNNYFYLKYLELSNIDVLCNLYSFFVVIKSLNSPLILVCSVIFLIFLISLPSPSPS